MLLDFGASREFPKSFVDKYIRIIEGAAEGDGKKVLEYSREVGFLVGYESKVMKGFFFLSVIYFVFIVFLFSFLEYGRRPCGSSHDFR